MNRKEEALKGITLQQGDSITLTETISFTDGEVQDDSEEDGGEEPSEFGRGIAVCLAKFSEHLANHHYEYVAKAKDGGPQELSLKIEMWMNAASDHFYDLNRDIAPGPLVELADFALKIGHGFTGQVWTMKDVQKIIALWRKACLALDQLLGVEDADWGEW